MLFRTILSFSLAAALCVVSPGTTDATMRAQRRAVSLLLINGKVFTADANSTVAQAIAIDGERIVAVGSTREIQSRFNGERVIDLGGRLVTPGFNDAHIHFAGGGLALMRVDLTEARSLEEAKQKVAARAGELPPGTWIRGRGWDHTLWGRVADAPRFGRGRAESSRLSPAR